MMLRLGRNAISIEISTEECKLKILQCIGDDSRFFLIFHNREHNRHWKVLAKHCLEPYSSSFPQRDDRMLAKYNRNRHPKAWYGVCTVWCIGCS